MAHFFLNLVVGIWAFSALGQSSPSCEGIRQETIGNSIKESRLQLNKTFEDIRTIQLEGDIGEFHYFVSGDKISNKYRLMIVQGPNYIDGSVSSMTWDQKSPIRLSKVLGDYTLIVKCGIK